MQEMPEMPSEKAANACNMRMTISNESILESLSKNGSKVYEGHKPAPRESFFLNEWMFRVTIWELFHNTHEWAAVCNWLMFHGIDPVDVPIDSSLFRDPDAHFIRFVKIRRDEDGRVVLTKDKSEIWMDLTTEQGEAGPLPWPEELVNYVGREYDE